MKKSNLKEKQGFVAASPWLQAIPKHLQEMLLNHAKNFQLDQNAVVYEFEDPPGGIYGVVSGAIAIRTDDTDQAVIDGHLLGPGAWFGEISAILVARRAVGATVVSDRAVILSVSLAAIEEIADRSPDIWRALAGLTAMSTQTAVQTARDLMIRNPRERCLAVLRRLSTSLGKGQDLPISQDELAVMSALSRGSVSRILSELEADGRIERGYRSIRLVDLGGDQLRVVKSGDLAECWANRAMSHPSDAVIFRATIAGMG